MWDLTHNDYLWWCILCMYWVFVGALHCLTHRSTLSSVVPQGRTYSATDKRGPDPCGVPVVRQHQIRHVRDRRVPAVRSGLWLGAVVSIPQSTKVLVDSTQPHGAYQVIIIRGRACFVLGLTIRRRIQTCLFHWRKCLVITNKERHQLIIQQSINYEHVDLKHIGVGLIRTLTELIIFTL